MKKWIGAILTLIIVGVIIAISVLPVGAVGEPDVSIPHVISYQGYLTDNIGNPVNGTISITFSIYDIPSGGTPTWTETQPSIVVNEGLFNALLGNVNPIDPDNLTGTSYLGIQVGSDPEMTPRQQIVSVAYALVSNHANTANSADSLHSADGSPEDAV